MGCELNIAEVISKLAPMFAHLLCFFCVFMFAVKKNLGVTVSCFHRSIGIEVVFFSSISYCKLYTFVQLGTNFFYLSVS